MDGGLLCCKSTRSYVQLWPWRLVSVWLRLEAVQAACRHRVNLGDADELVDAIVGSEGVLQPRLVANTVCGRLTRRSVGLVVRRGEACESRRKAAVVVEVWQ